MDKMVDAMTKAFCASSAAMCFAVVLLAAGHAKAADLKRLKEADNGSFKAKDSSTLRCPARFDPRLLADCPGVLKELGGLW